jgi:hypothetical protein
MTMGAASAARGQNGDVLAAADAAASIAAAGVVAASVECLMLHHQAHAPPHERCAFLESENNITMCRFGFFLSNNKSILVTFCDSQKKTIHKIASWGFRQNVGLPTVV